MAPRRRIVPVMCVVLATTVLGAAAYAQGVGDAERRAASKKRHQAYEEAKDKLAFLLTHADSKNDSVLVWVATELGNFNDPRAIRVLKRLQQYRQRGSESVPSIVARATRSLEKLTAADDLKRLAAPDATVATVLEIARKYAFNSNVYAERAIVPRRFELAAPVHPKRIVPFLVEYHAYRKPVRAVIAKHPEHVEPALTRGLRSPAWWEVVGCIKLIGEQKRDAHLPYLALLLCGDRSGDRGASVATRIWSVASDALVARGDASVPALTAVVYGGNRLAQFDAIGYLRAIGSPAALAALKRCADTFSHPLARGRMSADLLRHLRRAIDAVEGADARR